MSMSADELRELANEDKAGVIEELGHRGSRKARALLAELETSVPEAPAQPVVAEPEGENRLCPPCGGKGGFAGGQRCLSCNGSGQTDGKPRRWRREELNSEDLKTLDDTNRQLTSEYTEPGLVVRTFDRRK